MKKVFLIYVSSRAINGLVAIFSLIVFSRILNAEQYGKYSLWIAYMTALASISFQWIAVSASRFNAAHDKTPNVVTHTLRNLYACSALAVILLCIAIYYSYAHRLVSILDATYIVFGILAIGIWSIQTQVANSMQRPKSYALLTAARGLLTLILGSAFIAYSASASTLILAYGVAAFVSVIAFGATLGIKQAGLQIKQFRQITTYGMPLILSTTAIAVIDLADKTMIAKQFGLEVLAGYSAGFDLAQQTVGAAFNIMSLIYFPKIIKALENKDSKSYFLNKERLFREGSLATLFLLAVFFGMGDDITKLVFGSQIQDTAKLYMPWIALSIAISCYKTNYFDIELKAQKRTGSLLRIAIAMAFIKVFLNFVLMPILGPSGAIAATSITFILGIIMNSRKMPFSKFSNTTRQVLFHGVIASLIVLAFGLAFHIRLMEENSHALALLRLIGACILFSAYLIAFDVNGIRSSILSKNKVS